MVEEAKKFFMKARQLKGVNQTEDLIYETDRRQVFLFVADQTYLGRCVIALKRACPNLSEVTDEETLDFQNNVVKKLEGAISKAFGATLFNWSCLMNYAYRNIPPNPQVHWHLRPRYRETVNFGGESFPDTEFGSHYLRSTERGVSAEMRDSIIRKIKSHLS